MPKVSDTCAYLAPERNSDTGGTRPRLRTEQQGVLVARWVSAAPELDARGRIRRTWYSRCSAIVQFPTSTTHDTFARSDSTRASYHENAGSPDARGAEALSGSCNGTAAARCAPSLHTLPYRARTCWQYAGRGSSAIDRRAASRHLILTELDGRAPGFAAPTPLPLRL